MRGRSVKCVGNSRGAWKNSEVHGRVVEFVGGLWNAWESRGVGGESQSMRGRVKVCVGARPLN